MKRLEYTNIDITGNTLIIAPAYIDMTKANESELVCLCINYSGKYHSIILPYNKAKEIRDIIEIIIRIVNGKNKNKVKIGTFIRENYFPPHEIRNDMVIKILPDGVKTLRGKTLKWYEFNVVDITDTPLWKLEIVKYIHRLWIEKRFVKEIEEFKRGV